MPSSLDIMIPAPRVFNIGGKELVLAPLPLLELKTKFIDRLQEKITTSFLAASAQAETNSLTAPIKILDVIIESIQVEELIFDAFDSVINQRTGEKVNKDPELSPEFYKKYLTLPMIRQITAAFIEQNQIEEIIKNLSRLPVIGEALESLRMMGEAIFGQTPSNSSPSNTGETPPPPTA